ncbi:MAG: hypothetical protein ACAI44_11135 [Candidatus Sericytochromatia bacterium]
MLLKMLRVLLAGGILIPCLGAAAESPQQAFVVLKQADPRMEIVVLPLPEYRLDGVSVEWNYLSHDQSGHFQHTSEPAFSIRSWYFLKQTPPANGLLLSVNIYQSAKGLPGPLECRSRPAIMSLPARKSIKQTVHNPALGEMAFCIETEGTSAGAQDHPSFEGRLLPTPGWGQHLGIVVKAKTTQEIARVFAGLRKN